MKRREELDRRRQAMKENNGSRDLFLLDRVFGRSMDFINRLREATSRETTPTREERSRSVDRVKDASDSEGNRSARDSRSRDKEVVFVTSDAVSRSDLAGKRQSSEDSNGGWKVAKRHKHCDEAGR